MISPKKMYQHKLTSYMKSIAEKILKNGSFSFPKKSRNRSLKKHVHKELPC
jgi:hypothetical protein